MSISNRNQRMQAVEYGWKQFRRFDETSIYLKGKLTFWRKVVLILTIAGAILGAISSQLLDSYPEEIFVKLLGAAGAILVALAAYFSKNILGQKKESSWIRSRSIAEAIKSELFLFASNIAPYHKQGHVIQLTEKIDELIKKYPDVSLLTLTKEQEQEGIINDTITTDEYIEKRVKDQKDDFYLPKTEHNKKLLKCANNAMLWLGGIALVLGIIISRTSVEGAWVAVMSTISGAIAIYVFSNRYSYLALSYQATASHLEVLLLKWNTSGQLPRDKENLIVGCEQTISIENKGWMAELIKKKDKNDEQLIED